MTQGATTPEVTCTIDEVVGTLYLAREHQRPQKTEQGQVVTGFQTLLTSPGSTAQLTFPGGWSLHLGPYTRVQVGPTPERSSEKREGQSDSDLKEHTPALLRYGTLRVVNRPGDPNGPSVVVATRLSEITIPSDGRALVTIHRRTGKMPESLHVVALRRASSTCQPDGSFSREIPEGSELRGAGWIPVRRWTLRQLGTAERAALERAHLTSAESKVAREQTEAIPEESLRLEGVRIPKNRKIHITQADLPPTGELIMTGVVRSDRLPCGMGSFYVNGSRDGGLHWERLIWANPAGEFAYHLSPQEGIEYQVCFSLTEALTGKVFQTTRPIPLVYRERFSPKFSDLQICKAALPESPGPLMLYSDELEAFEVVVRGSITTDGPLSRIMVVGSADGGVHWRTATIEGQPEESQGTFRVSFPPVPGAIYRLRLKCLYANPKEATDPHQVLADWEAPMEVRYLEMRSTERAKALILELNKRLSLRDARAPLELVSKRFQHGSRDLSRASKVVFVPGDAVREAGMIQVPVKWERTEPSGFTIKGEAVFLFIKESDYALLDVLGGDPFAEGPLVRTENGSSIGPAAIETVTMGLKTVYDFEERVSSPYSEDRIPNDLGFFLDSAQGASMAVLGTHDRRLAIIGRVPLLQVRSLTSRQRLEYRAWIVPEQGTTYYLRTREGREIVFEVREMSHPDRSGQPTKIQVSFFNLDTGSE